MAHGRTAAKAQICGSSVEYSPPPTKTTAHDLSKAAPLLTGAFLLCGAFFTIALDALGSTAFMRSVRSYERSQMAAVYRTYLDFSELTPPLVYSVVLAFFGLGSVFATLGLLAAVCGFVTWRYLPKSL